MAARQLRQRFSRCEIGSKLGLRVRVGVRVRVRVGVRVRVRVRLRVRVRIGVGVRVRVTVARLLAGEGVRVGAILLAASVVEGLLRLLGLGLGLVVRLSLDGGEVRQGKVR